MNGSLTVTIRSDCPISARSAESSQLTIREPVSSCRLVAITVTKCASDG
ncbi:hypothetical protein [Fodinicola feengrottensis]|nr:hypothetical protein [Fodinicola feengrottensis]